MLDFCEINRFFFLLIAFVVVLAGLLISVLAFSKKIVNVTLVTGRGLLVWALEMHFR